MTPEVTPGVTPGVMAPGICDSGPTHWQTLWEEREPGRFTRFSPSDWDRPQLDDWIAALDHAVRGVGRPPVIVAHSLSCLLVPLWADSVPDAAAVVTGALLVAPVDPDGPAFPAPAHEFRHRVRGRLPFACLVVGSQNDHYASPGWTRAFATELGARHVDAGAVGHINADSELADWPQGRVLLDDFIAGLGG
ncbi:MAG: alpha/beta fold hydrolase [Candidatus Nanopelagicales bacterium]